MKRFFVPPVPPSGLRWHFPTLLSSPFQTWHDNCCFLFSLSIKYKYSDIGADEWHVTGWYMDGIAFSMTAVKSAACWHNKPQRTTITNQSQAFPCFNLLPKRHNWPLPWPAIIPLMNQRHWSRSRERQALGTASPIFSYFLLSLSLYCSVYFFSPLPSPAFICRAGLDGKSSGEV